MAVHGNVRQQHLHAQADGVLEICSAFLLCFNRRDAWWHPEHVQTTSANNKETETELYCGRPGNKTDNMGDGDAWLMFSHRNCGEAVPEFCFWRDDGDHRRGDSEIDVDHRNSYLIT
eukprot:2803502-Rhodomonas_salina.1